GARLRGRPSRDGEPSLVRRGSAPRRGGGGRHGGGWRLLLDRWAASAHDRLARPGPEARRAARAHSRNNYGPAVSAGQLRRQNVRNEALKRRAWEEIDSLREEAVGIALDIQDRKSTRLNSSHVKTSYAVFCL